MANYVYHRVICTQFILETFFIDENPFDDAQPLAEPYISFNKLFGCKSINEYSQNYGVHISYGMSFAWKELPDGFVEIKFCTRWEYPIKAIVRALELCKTDIVWYACEENHGYVSRFQWINTGIQEHVLPLDDDYWDWDEEIENRLQDRIEEGDYDDSVWYFIPLSKKRWRAWHSDNSFARYLNTSVVHVEKPDWLLLDFV